jgi:HD-GYP domain-containing protein (c-di-GMP phosphodiesterase class II)
MKEHAFHGYRMLKRIPFLQEAAEIVYAHQEKFDGSGYPRGLKGQEIPLGARIFAISDTLDAIRTDRPYRPGRPLAAAKEEIKLWSERQFDPEIVDVFLAMPDKIWEDLREQINASIHHFPVYATGAKGGL